MKTAVGELTKSFSAGLRKLPLVLMVLVWGTYAIAQDSSQNLIQKTDNPPKLDSVESSIVENAAKDLWVIGDNPDEQDCISNCYDNGTATDGKLFCGIDLLIIRPHLSDTFAFVNAVQNAGSIEASGQEFDFDYSGSFRLFIGYRNGNESEFRFTYWHYRGASWINESTPPANEFISDPFGNRVGGFNSGQLIGTKTVIETDVYDLEYMKRVGSDSWKWVGNIYGGLRVADVNLSYESHISLVNGTFTGSSEAAVDFVGVGPRLGAELRRFFGDCRRNFLFVKTNGSLLFGNYDVFTTFTDVTGPTFQETQNESLMKTIPVFETEVGFSRQVGDSLTFTVGWLFQAWFDIEFLNGDFGGIFDGAGDTNVLSFNGLFVRGEFAY